MKEKLEEARVIYETASDETKRALESLFPELKENKDEKIRKALVDYFVSRLEIGDENREWANGITYEEVVSYLEKQKDQNPSERSEREERLMKALQTSNARIAELVEENYNLKETKQEWGKEEEKDIQEASDYLRDYANNCVQGGNSKLYIQSLADRIESLRPQPHWKPSKEQMEALRELLNFNIGVFDYKLFQIVNQLYSDLQKL